MSIMLLLVNVLLYSLALLHRILLASPGEIREPTFNKKDLNFAGYIK